MKAFHGSEAIKKKYLNRVIAHQKADNLIRGTGWKNGKGCAVGCTLEEYNHERYPIELGIPEWLAHVEDKLFEGMSLDKSKTWPQVFLESINVGADLEKAKAPFLVMVLKSTLNTFDHSKFPNVLSSIERVIHLYESGETNPEEFNKIGHAAAADAADAAYAAAYAADAADAAYAAAYAADAAYAAYAAAYAADAAAAYAKTKTYDDFADSLIEILKDLK